jgi:ABC-type nitrate/sulfonate/bicarbonate transport system substrate-binding protein
VDQLRINSFGRLAPHDVAVAKGFYAAEDLEVEQNATQASKTQMGELKDGVWDVVHTHADNVFWWNEDNDARLLIVMALPTEPNLIFVVGPDIKGYADLRGKTIAADAAESGFVTSLRVLMQRNGLPNYGTDYRFEEIGANRTQALREGRFPGSMLNVGQENTLADLGFHVLDSITQLYQHYATIAVSRRQWVEQHEDVLVRYLRAHMRALLWIEDPANAAETKQYQARATLVKGVPKPPPFAWDGLREMLAIREEAGMLRGPVDPQRFADDQYYLQAIANLAAGG